MYSLIQNISSALNPLETKPLDASFGKKRRDFGDMNEGRNNEFHSPLLTKEDEGSILSIDALILFLEDFLEARLGSKGAGKSTKNQEPLAPWLKTRHSNDGDTDVKPEKAAKAYAHAAETLRPPLKSFRKSGAGKPSLQAELKSIYSLIVDLRRLQDSGVKQLSVGSKKTFIDGIFSAVDGARST